MSKKKDNSIDDLLFRPLILKDGDNERFIIICGSDAHVHQSLSEKGKQVKNIVNMIHMLDVTQTVCNGQPVLDSWVIASSKDFRKSLTELDITKHMDEVVAASSIILGEMSGLANRMKSLSSAMTTLKFVANKYAGVNSGSDTGNVVIGSEDQGLAHIAFKTLTGNVAKLRKEDVEKLGSSILQVIMSNIDTNLDDENELNKIKQELEVRLLEALPPDVQVGDINLNVQGIIDEIIKMRNHHEGDFPPGILD